MRKTRAIIDIPAFKRNIRHIKEHVGDAQVMAVVKANAYGHGSVEIAKAALQSGATFLGVAIEQEAATLRNAGIAAPILVLGSPPIMVEHVIVLGVSMTVYTIDQILNIENASQAMHKPALVHLKVDTGMGRIGIRTFQEMDAVLECLKECPNVEVQGMYTHFANADSMDKSFANHQAELFMKYVQKVRDAGHYPIVHMANSAATLDLPDFHCDMVRPGIAIYGYNPSGRPSRRVRLEPVMRVETEVAHVKQIDAGDTVSYDRTFTALQPTMVATLPVGYGDGYKRCLSNKAHVLIHGERCKVLGRICMDQMMVDVSEVEDVKVGDPVVLIGFQGSDYISADELAELADTISYDILLSFTQRVPREYKYK